MKLKQYNSYVLDSLLEEISQSDISDKSKTEIDKWIRNRTKERSNLFGATHAEVVSVPEAGGEKVRVSWLANTHANNGLGCHTTCISGINVVSVNDLDKETFKVLIQFSFPRIVNQILGNHSSISHFFLSTNFNSKELGWGQHLTQYWQWNSLARGKVPAGSLIAVTGCFIEELEKRAKEDPATYGRVFSSEYTYNMVHGGSTSRCRSIIWEPPAAIKLAKSEWDRSIVPSSRRGFSYFTKEEPLDKVEPLVKPKPVETKIAKAS